MWSVVVAVPAVQAEFGVDRGSASMAYTACMLGFAAGGVLMGALADRFGVRRPLVVAAAGLAAGFAAVGLCGAFWQFLALQFALVGLLGAATFGPLIADISRFFRVRRGLAVSLCASGNYLAGAIWPPIVQHVTLAYGWRTAYLGLGLLCAATMIPLALSLRGRPAEAAAGEGAPSTGGSLAAGFSPGVVQGLLVIAGLACCIAMATPQVHIVAYCIDLGYGPARGAEMLSAMLGLGIVSRLASGWLADRIGGLPTLGLGSVLQGLTLMLFLRFDALGSLYVISALFGLVQGGIVPSYAVVVREYFPAREAGARVGLVLMATMIGMALGGWMAGAINDATGSYRAAFAAGVLANSVNLAVVLALFLRRSRPRPASGGLPSPALAR